jgi:hypothetical protein
MTESLLLRCAWLCVCDGTISYPLTGVDVLGDKRRHAHCGVGGRVLCLKFGGCALGEVV